MSVTSPRLRRWKRVEYERLIECGIFGSEERLELIDGLLVCKEPQSVPHESSVLRVAAALRAAFGAGWIIESQVPIALTPDSLPEPDVSVIPGTLADYDTRRPAKLALAVEVSQSRLAFDRHRKAALYARARVPEYWIVNLVDRVLEVHRAPRRTRASRSGWRYFEVQQLVLEATVTPLAAPGAVVAVTELFPKRSS